jgi:PAS domain S-box-containing protein
VAFVSDPHPDSRGQRFFLLLALGLLLLHIVILLAAHSTSFISLFSNLVQLFAAVLAAFACLNAARRSQRFPRHFWLLFAGACTIWALAQSIATYYDSILRAPLLQPWPSDVIFFLFMAPLAMTLFIDNERGFDWNQWPHIFDLLQIAIVTLAAYLFTFESPSSWQQGWRGALASNSWVPNNAQALLLFGAFATAAFWGRRPAARSLYRRAAIFLFAYLCGAIPYLYLLAKLKMRSGTLMDLAWSVPFLAATVLAATDSPAPELPFEKSRHEMPDRRGSRWGLVHLASLLFPLLVLLMAAGVAEKQLLLAAILVILSFACSVARILFSEQQQSKAAEALQESNALLKSIFEGTGDSLFIKDLSGRYLIVNEAFAAMMKTPAQQLIGKSAAEFVSPEEVRTFFEQDRAVIASGKSQIFQSTSGEGSDRRTVLVIKAPWRDPSGKIVGVLASIRDITEYTQMEERLRQAQKMEAIGTLAGGVAHDFNNLLMVINGYSSVLSEALDSDPKLRHCADQIQQAGERAASLTRQLLAFSRKQTIQPTALNLNQVIHGMEKLLHRLIGEHIAIATKLAPDLGTVLADAGQMEQVILNLAVNSRDAMPDGGCLTFETANVELGGSLAAANNLKSGSYVEFVVRDTGVGMDVSVQSRLFEPFFTTKPAGKGTGLGLSTIYGILKQANGHITFASQPACGTTFRIYLPRTDSAQPLSTPAAEAPARLNGRETVLLVEDDSSVCDLIRTVLTEHGYTVLTPAQPQQAEELFEVHGRRVDLLLTDMVMPEVRGNELAKRLSAKNPRLKVLFMSGYVDDPVVRQGIEGNEMGFLQKPFVPATLVRKVREVLNASPTATKPR